MSYKKGLQSIETYINKKYLFFFQITNQNKIIYNSMTVFCIIKILNTGNNYFVNFKNQLENVALVTHFFYTDLLLYC